MCLGNRADSSARYINGQLSTLWENARHCTEKHGTGLKPTNSIVEYSTLLYEYYGPGKHGRYQPSRFDLAFFASFGRPRLEFVCNHEVILYLELLEGHYNLDYTKHSTNKSHNETIENYTIAFRITFSTHSIEQFQCKAIGNLDDYTMNIHILDIDSAILVSELSTIHGITSQGEGKSFHSKEHKINALTHYLTKYYLPAFKHAGYHVLHSLPDFDNLTNTTANVDYSVISKRSLSTDKLYGVSVDDINTYLVGLWLESAAFIDEHGTGHNDEEKLVKHFLAEHRSVWTESAEDLHLHLYLGPLQIRALCKREVALFIDIFDLHVHVGGGFFGDATHKFSGWKIAFIVDVIYEESDEGSVKRIKLDLQTARACEHLSTFTGSLVDTDLYIRIKETVTRYIRTYYFAILERVSLHHIFQLNERTRRPAHLPEREHSDDDSVDHHHHHEHDNQDDCVCIDVGSCGHSGNNGVKWGIIEHQRTTDTISTMKDFDFVTAVTQGAINAHFKQLWLTAYRRLRGLGDKKRTWESKEIEEETSLVDYSFVHHEHGDEVFFSASFTAPKVQLICHEGSHKVIFYLHLTQGYLKTLGPGKGYNPSHQAHSFSNWYLAFEVNLKLITASKETLAESLTERVKHAHKEHIVFRQLILDFNSAKFNLSLSSVPGLLDGHDFLLIRQRREALVHYIGHHYFNVLRRARHHVLYTIPVVEKHGGHHSHKQSLTNIKFEIVPFIYGPHHRYVEGLYGRHKGLFDRNMIVFLGVFGTRKLPDHGALRGHNWICGTERHNIPHGSVVLSRQGFLEGRILSRLEAINKETTIVPEFLGVYKNDWKLRLTTWGKHAMKKDLDCAWKEVTKTSDALEFEWRNREHWHYEHEGDLEGNGHYTVNCFTHNAVSVPTTHRATSGISVKGNLEFSMSYSGEGRQWSAKTKGSWSAVILFSSGARGLHITLTPAKIVPEFVHEKFHGTFGHSIHEEAFKHLEDEFPKIIDFSHIVAELKSIFEGCWTGLLVESRDLVVSYPIFNRAGDLILQLAPRVTESVSTQSSAASANGSSISILTVNGGLHHSKSSSSLLKQVSSLVNKGMDALHVSHSSSRLSSPTVSSSKKSIHAPSLSRSSSSTTVNTVKGSVNGNAKSETIVSETVQVEAEVA